MPIWIMKLLPYIAGALILLGAIWYVYDSGRDDERNKVNSEILIKSEDQRKSREKTEIDVRDMTDTEATKCLRNPTGCP